MPNELANHVSIVTGAASGIGRATAIALAAEGASLVIADKSDTGLRGTAEMICAAASVAVEIAVTDIREEAATEAMVRRAMERFGRVDSLVAAAGILRLSGTNPKPLANLSAEEWDTVIDTNLRGMFLSIRAVLPIMIAQRSGQVIAISSTAGRRGRAHDSAYCASKFGVIGLAESVAEEVRTYGIKVTTILPDAVATPFWDQNGPVPCPPDALPPERIAGIIRYLLTMPEDTLLINPVIAPFRSRRRVRKQDAASASES